MPLEITRTYLAFVYSLPHSKKIGTLMNFLGLQSKRIRVMKAYVFKYIPTCGSALPLSVPLPNTDHPNSKRALNWLGALLRCAHARGYDRRD